MSELRRRISSAHVLSIAALFVALGGTALALSRNEVKSKHIAPQAVKFSDLNKSVRTQAFQVREPEGEPGDSFDFDDSDALMASLSLPKGTYVISSTFQMTTDNGGVVFRCQLRAGGTRDQVERFGFTGNDGAALGVAHKFNSNGSAQLRCLDGSALDTVTHVSEIEIIATKVAKLKNS